MAERFGASSKFYPTIHLGDGRWDHVITALRRTGTKRDTHLADVIDKQVQASRRSHAEREARGRDRPETDRDGNPAR